MRTSAWLAAACIALASGTALAGDPPDNPALDFRSDQGWRNAALRAAAPELDAWTAPRDGLVVTGAVDGSFVGPDVPGSTAVVFSPARALAADAEARGLVVLTGSNGDREPLAWWLPAGLDGLPTGSVEDPQGRSLLVLRVDRLQMGHAATDAVILALVPGEEEASEVVRVNEVRHHGCGLPAVPQEVTASVVGLSWDNDRVEASPRTYTAPCGSRAEPAPDAFRPAPADPDQPESP
ncbi:MAG: hypothetical protein ACXIUZ_06170 [Lysobacteraceae bacterium]